MLLMGPRGSTCKRLYIIIWLRLFDFFCISYKSRYNSRENCLIDMSGWRRMHGASCRLNLDHDETNKYINEKWEWCFAFGNIYYARYRKYNQKRIVVIILIVTKKRNSRWRKLSNNRSRAHLNGNKKISTSFIHLYCTMGPCFSSSASPSGTLLGTT